jgi:glutamate N-acetyltransferase/amino-acid N-acetyltransferase
MAKGAGMIAPKMATLLAYVLTDAAVGAAALRRVLAAALPQSFNAIVVDGDMSTNDTVLLLANGVAGNRPLTERQGRCLRRPPPAHARWRAWWSGWGGATKVIDRRARGAQRRDAGRVADAIARSPL